MTEDSHFDKEAWMNRIQHLIGATADICGGYPAHHWVWIGYHPKFGEIFQFGREPGSSWEVLQ